MAGSKFLVACLIVSTIDIFSGIVNGQVLQPPYFNIATGKNISATSTCGEEVGEELFCKLTGNTATDVIYNSDVNLIQGQICDTCDPKNPLTSHPAYHAIDGTKQWWQSPPLSRGLEYNEVNVTIDFGQQFHVAYVIVKFANSPRPALWVLERSTDYGQTFTPWQYFASTDSDCNTYFGMQSLEAITRDDQVICSTEYSKIVPLENGEIVVSLVNNRPSANNFSYAAVLQEWTKATTVRLRLIRTNTLLSHLLALARQDPTVTRRYYYSIKDVSIGGRCVCNGHADKCDTPVPGGNRFQLQCTCRHNTCGEQCEICCPGFEQKKWRPATVDSANECEPCNCHGHSNECVYDEEIAEKKLSLDIHGNYEGGGVCQRCQHNTQGINCEECKAGYYRPRGVPLDSPEVCQPCDCNFFYSTGSCSAETGQCECRPEYAGLNCDECAVGYYGYPTCRPCDCHRNGTEGGVCEVGGRQCPCKPNYIGLNCDRCSVGYYDFPACLPCDCDHLGSRDYVCSPLDGQCQCRINYGGRACDECKDGYYNYPACQACSCDAFGTAEEICDKDTGACICKEKYGGPRCSNCDVSYYSYPNCYDCDCDTAGSAHDGCRDSGQCPCLPNFSGKKCDMCASAYFKYPECTPCNCHRTGSFSISCDQITGQCNCRSNFQGVTCSECAEGFYNFPACEECKCDPAGVVFVPGEPLAGCGAATQGLCQCKEKVGGRTCNLCDPLYWNLQFSNPVGCEECHCYKPGTVSGIAVCDVVSGQCTCKEYVDGRRCDQCEDGAFDLQTRNVFGCQACGCDLGGARDENCDKSTGQCVCKPRVSGRTCDRPLDVHFFHDLYHIKYEIEDGRAPRNKPVRFAFRESDFPGYSWRGYAVMSAVQPEVLIPVEIRNPSLYRLVFRYVSQNNEPVNGEVTVTPRTQSELAIEQTSSVVFNPGTSPQLVTVSGNGVIMPFVMDPGQWIISVKSPENILLDYLVLLPSAYYEAPLLQVTVNDACKAGSYQEACNEYAFPSVATYPTIEAEHGYYQDSGQRYPTQTFRDRSILQDLNVDAMAQLDEQQPTLGLSLPVPRPGKYMMVIQYFDGGPNAHRLDVSLLDSRTEQDGHSNIYDCQHLCRAVVLDSENKVKEFDIKQSRVTIYLEQEQPYDLAIDSVTLIPVEEWNEDFVNQALECVLRKPSDICVGSPYLTPPGTQKWEVESLAYLPSSSLVHTGVTPNVDDPNTALYTLDGPGGVPSVEMRDILPDNGRYVFVVHYYQPTSVSYDVNFDIRGRPSQSGTFNAKFCPHVSGCRSVVTTHDGDVAFEISPFAPDLVITIPDDKTLWLDYVMAIPEETYSSDVLEPLPIDRAGEFIRECGQNDFYISSETTGFCRDSVFSLTTDYNNGAVKCDCNYAGSTSFSCDPLGGQCPCKPNVIGRTCDRCKTGYYAFPNCIPCGCVTGVCDDNTGACICPPNVGGPNCDQCLPRTFGYDPFIGCEECDCDPKGVLGDLNCDLVNGQCNCLPNVGGRQCDVCKAGYFNHPRCVPCTCDLRGTTSDVCDQRSSACLCKENVEGVRCDKCKVGTFYLEERNPKGCTSCFCFGITQECKSSSRVFDPITTMNDWTATNFADGRVTVRNNVINIQVLGSGDDPAQAIYFVAPKDYRGNKVSSYGGVLEYSITYRNLRNDVSVRPMRRPDVIFSGNNFELVYSAPSQPVAGVTLTVVVDILESSFQHSIGGGQVSREELMMTLADLTKLHIRAQYMTNIQEASLSFVSFDVAMKKKGTKRPAETVEQCRCPANYKGLSCEKCEDGYYRVSSGAYLGVCVQCECNGHSDICDQETGTCLDCQDNTAGPNCGECKTGYVGDATNGTPYDCQICSCPYPTEINNYASTCVLGSGGETLSCECLPGYTGERCTSCAEGYYGDPTIIGGEGCRPCECNNNELVDPSDGGRQCDAFTGQCLRCRPGTAGHNCERCADGYYGDAIVAKDCKECDCDECGTESCHPETGVCLCKLGVTGSRCHKCPRNYYGFNTCNGCQSCECKSGSEYSQCDDDTGQCDCKPGVGGRDCGECLPGYWNYQLNGCERCDCGENLRCHPTTGDCVCLPGAKGPKCDQCEERYVLTEQGCQECDSCVTLLLDEMDVMDYNVSDAIDDLTGVSVGVDAVKRLMKINDTAYELWAKLPGVKNGYSGNLQPILDDINELKDDANDIEARSRKAKKDAKPIAKEAEDTDKRAAEVEDLVNKAARKARESVDNAAEIADNIGRKGDSDVDELLAEAKKIVREIEGRDFSEPKDNADEELELAEDALKKAKRLNRKYDDQEEDCKAVEENMDDLMSKFRELLNETEQSNRILDEVETFNMLNEFPDYKNTLKEAQEGYSEAEKDIGAARDLLNQAEVFLDDADTAVQKTAIEASKLDAAQSRLDPFVENLKEQNIELEPLVVNATIHAYKLQRQANLLDDLIADTRELGDKAVAAATAYKNIASAIDDAWEAAQDAKEAAESADEKSNGQSARAKDSKKKSKQLQKTAKESKDKVEGDLQERLDNAKKDVEEIDQLNTETEEELRKLKQEIDAIPSDDLSARAEDAMDTADSAQNKAQEALDSIYSIGQTLPDKKLLVAEIPQKIDDINRAMDRAASRLRKLNEMVPQAQDLLNDMSAQKDKMKDLGMKALSNLTELQDKIERAQDQANRIEVAMGFRKTTTVRLRSVPNNEDASASSSISLFFKTKENDGFLAFLGGQGGGDDYMALEIVDGNVVFYYDLGSGFAEIKSNKKVADDVWHQAVGERVGMSGTLTIKTDKENDDETTGRSPPSFSVFDLTASAQFFVGGVPQEFGLPANIKISRFIGCIDDLKFMGLAIGLWNFAEAVNADRGCKERSVLQAPPENIFTLNGGDSYVILPKGNINIYQRTEISFQMKTFADTGLLFFAGKGTDFISVELRNGHVLFQYDFGSGVAEIMSAEKCNSGNWTRVTAQRNKQAGSLTINKNDAVRGTSPGNHHGLETSDVLYLGGVKGIKVPSAVTSVSYMGCLKDVLVQRKAWDDLYVNEGSKGLYSGCQDRAARTAAFTRTDSYIAMPGVNINRNSDISLRFKTQQPSGLMVFATNDDQSNSFSIAMVDGGVVVQTDVSNDISTVESNKKRYDDGEWHFVNFEKKGTGLSLVIDDTDTKEVDGTGKKKTTTSSPIYFGGTPSGYDITSQVPTRDEFIGCISDVSINSRLQDFAQSESAEDVSLAGCPLGADEDTFAAIVASPVTASPIQNEKITTTQSTVDKVAGCALPLRPSVNEADSEDGIKFGDVVESRFEYDALADKLDNKRSVFYISFKTSASHGLIFYAADDRQIDFISLYMFDGGVVYSFNCGTGTLILQSPLKYNDGNWHTVKFLREQQQGTLEIDGVQVARGEAGGAARKITVTPPFYVGGIPDTMSAKNVHELARTSFDGCLLLEHKENYIKFGEPDRTYSTQPCTSNSEKGTFFAVDGGYIVQFDEFTVGLDLKIQIEIKPRVTSGTLLSVQSDRGDFLSMEMLDGNLVFSADNGEGIFSTTYEPNTNQGRKYLCDGEWHSIVALKAKNVVTLNVDGKEIMPVGIGRGTTINTDTKNELYIGGLPDGVTHKGITTTEQFVGCIKNLVIGSNIVNFNEAFRVAGAVQVNSCPTT